MPFTVRFSHSKLYASIEFILIKMLKRHPKYNVTVLIMNKVQNNIFGGKLNFFRASKTCGRSARMGKCLQKFMSVPAISLLCIHSVGLGPS